MKFVFYFGLLFNFLPNHRPAISGADIIVNNINKPYSQNEIDRIANIIVLKNGEDLTNQLVLIENEYLNNERNLGYYKQTYQITIEEFDGKSYFDVVYQYVLTIYNLSEIKENDILQITIKTNPDKYLSLNEIIEHLSKELDDNIFRYEVISSNYFDNGLEDSFLIELIITNRKNEKQLIEITISSYYEVKEQRNVKFFILVILVISTIIFIIIKLKRRKKKNEN